MTGVLSRWGRSTLATSSWTETSVVSGDTRTRCWGTSLTRRHSLLTTGIAEIHSCLVRNGLKYGFIVFQLVNRFGVSTIEVSGVEGVECIIIIIITSGVLEHKWRASLNYTIVKRLIIPSNTQATKI